MNYKGKKHKHVGSPIYYTWFAMKQRCGNLNHKSYKDYGDRGITYDKHWEIFLNFYDDMGDRPEGKTLDRINNDLGYSKENCKWSTHKEQAANRRERSKRIYTEEEIEERRILRNQKLLEWRLNNPKEYKKKNLKYYNKIKGTDEYRRKTALKVKKWRARKKLENLVT